MKAADTRFSKSAGSGGAPGAAPGEEGARRYNNTPLYDHDNHTMDYNIIFQSGNRYTSLFALAELEERRAGHGLRELEPPGAGPLLATAAQDSPGDAVRPAASATT
jgi:hypothetical protein